MRELWDGAQAQLNALLHWVEGFAHTPYGWQALFALAFLESSVFPVPPDVLLIPLCLGHPQRAFFFALMCSLGSVFGGMAGYALGYYGGRPILLRLFRPEWIAAVEEKFDRYNAWATGVAGFTPLPYKLFTVSGGAFRIDFRIFAVASAISRSMRFFLIATLLFFYGEPIQGFLERRLGILTVAFAILLVGGFWLLGRGVGRHRPAAAASTDDMADDEHEARQYLISGQVQGVGFRFFVQRQATMLRLHGWVKNLPDGRVEVLASGSTKQLELLEELLRRGPSAAEVEDLAIHRTDPPLTTGFHIHH
jgi:membrane protein YqaA with SNARE-associated domain/acylphosphatase